MTLFLLGLTVGAMPAVLIWSRRLWRAATLNQGECNELV